MSNLYYSHIIHMIEGSTFEDRTLLDTFASEDPYHKKSFYYMVRNLTNHVRADGAPANNQKAYSLLIEAASDYILAYSTAYAAKRRLYDRMCAWCKHMGQQYNIADYETYVKELPQQVATDIAVELLKDLHDPNGISKTDLSGRYNTSEKTIQVCLHKLKEPHCADPLRIGGQAVHINIENKKKHLDEDLNLSSIDRRERKNFYYTPNTLSPLVFQANVMQVETMLKSLQLNYDYGNEIPLDIAVDIWGQLSDYVRDRIREVFGQRDPKLMDFLDVVECATASDGYRFMTESEMMSEMIQSGRTNFSELLTIADKGSLVCNISLLKETHQTRKNQRIFLDHDRQEYYAVPANDLSAERLYFTEDEVNEISEA